jgi:glycosyltransferase involved in cell wall biosynthesis
MNILLSAYACEPNKGSEPGVGWSWAIETAKYHNVWVITRDNNEPTISTYMNEHPEYQNKNLHFIYVGLSKKFTFWKKGRRGMRLFYKMWQYKAVKVAMEWHKKIFFDIVQHVTFVSYTQPTYMYKLGIPLIWGPVSGGENIPECIKIEMSMKEKIIEFIRLLSQYYALIIPSIRKTMKYSKYILVATEETKEKIPTNFQEKTLIMPAIGIEKMPEVHCKKKLDDKIRIIMAGRLIYWKAFNIGIEAFLQIADKYQNIELHILGEGDKKESLKKLAGLYLDKKIFFENPVPHDRIFEFYKGFDLFLNTSLRDSGCMVAMEAMSVGLPIICINTGGLRQLTSDDSSKLIEPMEYEMMIKNLTLALENMIQSQDRGNQVGINAKNRILSKFLYEKKYRDFSDAVLENLNYRK